MWAGIIFQGDYFKENWKSCILAPSFIIHMLSISTLPFSFIKDTSPDTVNMTHFPVTSGLQLHIVVSNLLLVESTDLSSFLLCYILLLIFRNKFFLKIVHFYSCLKTRSHDKCSVIFTSPSSFLLASGGLTWTKDLISFSYLCFLMFTFISGP